MLLRTKYGSCSLLFHMKVCSATGCLNAVQSFHCLVPSEDKKGQGHNLPSLWFQVLYSESFSILENTLFMAEITGTPSEPLCRQPDLTGAFFFFQLYYLVQSTKTFLPRIIILLNILKPLTDLFRLCSKRIVTTHRVNNSMILLPLSCNHSPVVEICTGSSGPLNLPMRAKGNREKPEHL